MADGALRPRVKPPRASSDAFLYRRLIHSLWPHRWLVIISFCGYLLYSAGVVLLADLLHFLLDALGESRAEGAGLLAWFVQNWWRPDGGNSLEVARVVVPLAVVLLVLLRGSGFFGGNFCLQLAAHRLVHDMRCALFDALLYAPGEHFSDNSQGRLLSLFSYTLEQVTSAITGALQTVLREGLVVIALLGYMVYLNWKLSLVFLAVTPLVAVIVLLAGRRFRRYGEDIQDSMGEVSQFNAESLRSFREIRLFDVRSFWSRKFTEASARNTQHKRTAALLAALSTPLVQFVLALAVAALVWLALQPAFLNDFSTGAFVAFLVAAVQLGKPIRQLTAVQSDLQRGLAAADEFYRQIDGPAETDTGSIESSRVSGRISIRNLSYSRGDDGAQLLRDVSLEIPAGAHVVVVGRSGSGKTSLINLITRLWEPPARCIFLDSVPVEQYTLRSLRRQFAVVDQSPQFLRASIRDNLTFGRDGFADEDLWAALGKAQATDYVRALPAGLDSMLGDAGEGLSGGQLQRLAVARALLGDVPVLILDEASSSLDTTTADSLHQIIADIDSEQTRITISHRIGQAQSADLIVVMYGGRIVQQGTHSELSGQNGLYNELRAAESA